MDIQKPKILVVEDNYVMARAVCDLVRDCGFSVAGAIGRIDAGRRFLEQNDVDGAIVDINLDGTPSFEICEELHRRNVPFFFLTGYEKSIIPESLRETHILTKPIEMRQFRSALEALAPHHLLAPEQRSANTTRRGNYLLDSIEPDTWSAMEPHLKLVNLEAREMIEREGQIDPYAYFPIEGLCSLYAHANGRRISVAMVGKEAVIGMHSIFGALHAALETIVQFPMRAWRIDATILTTLATSHVDLQKSILQYVHRLIGQIGETAVAIGHAKIEQRIARWLLAVAERSGIDRICVTHDELAQAFAVRRSGITVALHHLEAHGAIKSTRKLVRILDKEILATQAGPFRPRSI